jgi:hypothetical protein
MEKNVSTCSVLRRLNLDDIEEVVSEVYHQEGATQSGKRQIYNLPRKMSKLK